MVGAWVAVAGGAVAVGTGGGGVSVVGVWFDFLQADRVIANNATRAVK